MMKKKLKSVVAPTLYLQTSLAPSCELERHLQAAYHFLILSEGTFVLKLLGILAHELGGG